MKLLRIIKKSFRDAFRSVFRNFSLSMASISCTTITLILVAVAILVTYNVNSVTKDIEVVLTIVVFVDKKATDSQIEEVKGKLLALDNVNKEELKFDSAEDIKASLSKDEDLKDILAILDENPVPSSFIVKVEDVRKISDTAEEIGEIELVTNVKYGESLVNKLLSMFDVVRNVCVIAVAGLFVVTAFLIGNTIKITIISRRHEIDIMRLVGTSNFAIKLPFQIEGFILGVIGSIIPIILTIYGYTFLYDFIGGKLFTELVVLVPPSEIVYITSLMLVIMGGILGMSGSYNSVKRYLKI